MFSKLKVTQLEKNMPTNNMYVNGEVAEAQKAVLALPSRFCTYIHIDGSKGCLGAGGLGHQDAGEGGGGRGRCRLRVEGG